MLAYIPSPPSNGISIGPMRLHMYGFLIVAGVFASVWLADRRWQDRGGAPGTFSAIALWAVPGGLIGARLYHVITDYELYTHRPLDALKIWQGGLGIWGGIAGGTFAAWLFVRRHHLDFPAIMDAVAPALPLAQAIGRWGNYFNQELFGRPTTLPWGLKIDAANRPTAFAHAATFQPTFLYESLWDLAVVLLVLWVEKHVRLRKGYLFAVYVALYTFGRFFTEYMRIDFAHKVLGLRINDWVSVIIFVAATAIVLKNGLVRGRRTPDEPDGPPSNPDDEADGPALDRPRVTVAAGALGGDTLTEGSIGIGALIDYEEPATEPPATEPPPPKAENIAAPPSEAPPVEAPSAQALLVETPSSEAPSEAPPAEPLPAEPLPAEPLPAEPLPAEPLPAEDAPEDAPTALDAGPPIPPPPTTDAPESEAATAQRHAGPDAPLPDRPPPATP